MAGGILPPPMNSADGFQADPGKCRNCDSDHIPSLISWLTLPSVSEAPNANHIKRHWRVVDMASKSEFKEQVKAIASDAYGFLQGPSNPGNILYPGSSILDTADGEVSHV